MVEIQHPIQSTSGLLKALAVALVVAIVLLITIVLPAEFGIDPLGIGSRLGLNNLTVTESQPVAVVRQGESELAFRQDETQINVPAGSGLEYKFYLAEHASLNYEWSSDAPIYFDMHGEPEGDTSGYFESYAAATVDSMQGNVTVPFAGSHGWYWRNDTNDEVTVSLKTLGNYEVIGLK
ncbi:MAG: hypothetical protein WD601_12595 [Pseudohongiellaceae bacterium]